MKAITAETGKINEREAIDTKLLRKAVSALSKVHEKARESSADDKRPLFGDEAIVQVQFGLEIAPIRPSVKPIRVEIPNPIFHLGQDDSDALEEPEVCLIVKTESKKWVQTMIRDHSDHMKFVKKVLSLDSLRTKHSQFSQRRELLNKYSVFMVDDRIVPMLTKSLGKDFLKAKKQPIPIALTRKEALPFAILKAEAGEASARSNCSCAGA